MKRYRDAIETPGDAVHSRSALWKIIGAPTYLDYCTESQTIQDHWRAPTWVEWPINTATQQPVPVLTSNINAGDFFNCGKTHCQICVVTSKITVCGGSKSSTYNPTGSPSIHPNGDMFRYEINGERGGFSFQQPHSELISGFFIWLPLPFQLQAIGLHDEAQALHEIGMNSLK